MTKFKERTTLVPLLFLFPLIFILKANGTFFIRSLPYYNEGIALKFATITLIFAHVSLTLLLYASLYRV